MPQPLRVSKALSVLEAKIYHELYYKDDVTERAQGHTGKCISEVQRGLEKSFFIVFKQLFKKAYILEKLFLCTLYKLS